MPLQHRRDPAKKIGAYFDTVDLIEHLVPSAGIEIMRDVLDANCTVALDQDSKSFQPLAHLSAFGE